MQRFRAARLWEACTWPSVQYSTSSTCRVIPPSSSIQVRLQGTVGTCYRVWGFAGPWWCLLALRSFPRVCTAQRHVHLLLRGRAGGNNAQGDAQYLDQGAPGTWLEQDRRPQLAGEGHAGEVDR